MTSYEMCASDWSSAVSYSDLEDVKVMTRLTGGKTSSTEAYRRDIYMGAESRHSRGGKDEKRPDI